MVSRTTKIVAAILIGLAIALLLYYFHIITTRPKEGYTQRDNEVEEKKSTLPTEREAGSLKSVGSWWSDWWCDVKSALNYFDAANVCGIASDCNACGEQGNQGCSGCTPESFSDCMAAQNTNACTAGTENETNWCHYYYSNANYHDPRSVPPCENLDTKGPPPAYITDTKWFCVNGYTVSHDSDTGWRCKADPVNCIQDQSNCTVSSCQPNWNVASNAVASAAANALAPHGIVPPIAIKMGLWRIASNGSELIFNIEGDKYDGDNGRYSSRNGSLQMQTDGTMLWLPKCGDRTAYLESLTYTQMPYGFCINDWIVFVDVIGNSVPDNPYNGIATNRLCFAKNPYITNEGRQITQVYALTPIAFDDNGQPMYNEGMYWSQLPSGMMVGQNAKVDMTQLFGAINKQYPQVWIGDWRFGTIDLSTSNLQPGESMFCIWYEKFAWGKSNTTPVMIIDRTVPQPINPEVPDEFYQAYTSTLELQWLNGIIQKEEIANVGTMVPPTIFSLPSSAIAQCVNP